MKHLTYILLLSLIFTTAQAQFSISYQEGLLVLKTGDTLKGYGNIYNHKLRFKDVNKKNRKDYYFSEIASVKFTIYGGKKNSEKTEFTLVPIVTKAENENKEKGVLVELLVDKENIKIYGMYDSGGGTSMGPGLGGQISTTNMSIGFNANTYIDYYCYLKEDKYPRLLYRGTSFMTFKKMASECFSDCEALIAKITKEEFTKKDIIDIANFYNDQCN